MTIITPKPISGFPELLPEGQLVLNRCIAIIRETFELSGFAPIETPSVERKETLTAKGGNEKEIYALSRLSAAQGENAETDVALHFDLTVPLARYVAQNSGKLVFPFRRYQIQKVWRGERSQAGRYREFYQCDIDVIGRGSVSLLADAEMPVIINRIFRQMGIGAFQVRLNNRRMLQGAMIAAGVKPEQNNDVLHAIDDLEKIGRDKVRGLLLNKVGLSEDVAERVLAFVESGAGLDTNALLHKLHQLKEEYGAANETYARGADELREVVDAMRSLGMPEDAFAVDLTVVRGLEYYTGTVYETRLLAHPDLGSICSGGRYDDLASYFTTEKFPGVGISIGLSRLVFRLIEVGVLKAGPSTPAKVLVTVMDPARMQDYLKIGAELREAGISTEVFLEKGRIGDQLKYASRKGFACAVIAGGDEFLAGVVKVKNLNAATEQAIPRERLIEAVKAV